MQAKRIGKQSLLLVMFIASVALAEQVLSKEFLEYLAEFETEEGEWLDPEELEMMASLGENDGDDEEASNVE